MQKTLRAVGLSKDPGNQPGLEPRVCAPTGRFHGSLSPSFGAWKQSGGGPAWQSRGKTSQGRMPPTAGGSGGERMWCILTLTFFILKFPP